MFTIDKYNPRVDIKLDAGIHVLPTMSATGKTYLAKLLHKYGEFGERCFSYSYHSRYRLEDVLDASKHDVVLLDRYDMYYGEGIKAIEQFSESGIVLLDSKKFFKFLPFERCFLFFDVDKVLVCR